MLFCIPLYSFPSSLIVKQTVSLHDMQSFGERCAIPVDHRKPGQFDFHGVDHKRVAFVMADRISIPRWRHLCWMRLVHPHLTELMIEGVKEGDLIGLLEQLHSIIYKNEGHLLGPTLVARGRIPLTG